ARRLRPAQHPSRSRTHAPPPPPLPSRDASVQIRCGYGPPSFEMQPASAKRADCRELRRAAIASLPQSTLLEQHPRPRRSHEISSPQARAPVASVLATALRSEDLMIVPPNPRFASQCQNPKSLWLPSTCRTSIGIFAGFPPGPGAADARAAILYACSGLSTSITQYPARNSFDSGNTPSVTGSPLLPARTIFASCGQASPFVSTKTPES